MVKVLQMADVKQQIKEKEMLEDAEQTDDDDMQEADIPTMKKVKRD